MALFSPHGSGAGVFAAASRETIEGAAHVPQLTTPERYIEITTRALRQKAEA